MSTPTAERKIKHKIKRRAVAKNKAQRKKEYATWTKREETRKEKEKKAADNKARRERETQKARDKNLKKPNFLRRLLRVKPKRQGKQKGQR